MGEAKRRKLAGTSPAPIKMTALNESGRRFLERATPEFMQRYHAEMDALRGSALSTRLLEGPDGEMLLYALEDAKTTSPLEGLVRALDRRYQSPHEVPLWLVPMILEEPWELVMLGYPVSRREVVQLHAIFPWFPKSAEQTWARCAEEAATICAEQEAEALKARNAGRAVSPRRATI